MPGFRLGLKWHQGDIVLNGDWVMNECCRAYLEKDVFRNRDLPDGRWPGRF